MVAWLSANTLVSINAAALHRAWLVLEWVTNHLLTSKSLWNVTSQWGQCIFGACCVMQIWPNMAAQSVLICNITTGLQQQPSIIGVCIPSTCRWTERFLADVARYFAHVCLDRRLQTADSSRQDDDEVMPAPSMQQMIQECHHLYFTYM